MILCNFASASTLVVTIVRWRSRIYSEFTLVWWFMWACSSPFILPLSVSSLDLTAESDHFSTVYCGPVGFHCYNSTGWPYSFKHLNKKQFKVTITILSFAIIWMQIMKLFMIAESKLTGFVNLNFLACLCVVSWVSSFCFATVESFLWDTELSIRRGEIQ